MVFFALCRKTTNPRLFIDEARNMPGRNVYLIASRGSRRYPQTSPEPATKRQCIAGSAYRSGAMPVPGRLCPQAIHQAAEITGGVLTSKQAARKGW